MESSLLVCNFTAAGPAYNQDGQVTIHCLSRKAFTNLLHSSSPEHTSPFRMLTLGILWWTFYFNQYTCRHMDVHTLFHMVLSWHTYLPVPTHYICESTEIKLWHPGHNFKSCYVLSKSVMFSSHYEPEVFKRVCLMNVVSSHLCQPLKIGFPWQLTPIGSLMLLRSYWDGHSAEIHCRATSFICSCSPDPCACTAEGKTWA